LGKKVIIIGAGPGGLTAGMLLAHNGYEVDIFEQKEHIGGRNASIKLGEFTFDTGPTFLMLADVLHDLFRFVGRNIEEYMDLKEIEPLYRLRFNGEKDFYPSRDSAYMARQLQEIFPEDEAGYRRFMEKEKVKFEKLYNCLKVPYHSIFHLLRPMFIKALPKLDLNRSLYDKLSEYFQHEEMRIAMTFQSKYLGMSPWNCPGAFTILSYLEHGTGIYHPIGGLNKISEAMADIVKEEGGRIHLSAAVRELLVENNTAVGVLLENGEKILADQIIINADFAHAMSNIVKPADRRKYTNAKLKKLDYSCSTFMLYLGLDKKYDISHHNIIFADDYKRNVFEIAQTKVLSADPSFYLQNASVTDPTLAPEGKSALYVLVPVPNNTGKIDWLNEKDSFRDLIIRKIKEKTELTDIDQHIEVEKVITPLDWENEYSVYNGATFNLSHKISQMLYFRPHNQFDDIKNCYLVGGGTHPGSGLPTIYESGRISANMIMQDGVSTGFNYQDIFELKFPKPSGREMKM
jgi:phytoene desaturase